MRKPIKFKGQQINPETGDLEPIPGMPTYEPHSEEIEAELQASREAIEAEEVEPEEVQPDTAQGSRERHAWVEDATAWAKAWLANHGTEVPASVRVSVGMPFRARKNVIGQCWHTAASSDGHREVFVSPVLGDGPIIVSTLIHELIHAALPDGEGHGSTFKRHAKEAGLVGKATATVAGEELEAAIRAWIDVRGAYSAGTIDPAGAGGKKQGTRLIKCECAVCGYTARTTAKWLNTLGPPICPGEDHGPMEASLPEGGGE